MRDWAEEARTGRYRLTGDSTDYAAALMTIGQPLLVVDVAGDRLLSAQAVDDLADRLPRHRTRRTVPAGAPDHFRWVRTEPDRVVQAVEQWLEDTSVPS